MLCVIGYIAPGMHEAYIMLHITVCGLLEIKLCYLFAFVGTQLRKTGYSVDEGSAMFTTIVILNTALAPPGPVTFSLMLTTVPRMA